MFANFYDFMIRFMTHKKYIYMDLFFISRIESMVIVTSAKRNTSDVGVNKFCFYCVLSVATC